MAAPAVIDFNAALRGALGVPSFDLRDVWWIRQYVRQFNGNGALGEDEPPGGAAWGLQVHSRATGATSMSCSARVDIALLPCFTQAHDDRGHAVHQLTAARVAQSALDQRGFPDDGFVYLDAALVEHNQRAHGSLPLGASPAQAAPGRGGASHHGPSSESPDLEHSDHYGNYDDNYDLDYGNDHGPEHATMDGIDSTGSLDEVRDAR
jgi:hypothetical protein